MASKRQLGSLNKNNKTNAQDLQEEAKGWWKKAEDTRKG